MRFKLPICMFLMTLVLAGCGGGGHAAKTAATSTTVTDQPQTCNGLAQLCDRRLDQIVFPATHNSFSASEQPGWRFPNQRYPIARQLDDGIRGLLIDVYFGIQSPNRDLVRTDLNAEGTSANKILAAAPAQARVAAERIAGPLGVGLPDAKPELYMCHSFCELGSVSLASQLQAITSYLEKHRRVFLMIVIEDYVPPSEIERAFEQAGLAKLAVTLNRDAPLPTLGELLDSGKQLAVFSEDFGGQPSWYMKAFSFIQDTPLGAKLPTQLSCARARGETDSPLFMINDWIPPYPPSARLSREIGRTLLLRRRIERCQTERHFTGSIVAVDFYDETNVVSVARQLNSR